MKIPKILFLVLIESVETLFPGLFDENKKMNCPQNGSTFRHLVSNI